METNVVIVIKLATDICIRPCYTSMISEQINSLDLHVPNGENNKIVPSINSIFAEWLLSMKIAFDTFRTYTDIYWNADNWNRWQETEFIVENLYIKLVYSEF